MSLIIGLLYLLLINSFFIAVLNKKFEITIAPSIMCIVFLMFFTGLFGNIRLGFYLSFILIIFTPIYLFTKKDKIKPFLDNYFSIGLVAFIFIFIYIAMFQRNRYFSKYDEFSHWGQMVFNSLELNKFYSIKESTLYIHKDYPPFFTLVELLFCYLNKFIYTEGSCYRGLTTFCLSLFLPLLSFLDIKKLKDWFKLICLVLIFVFSGLMMTPSATSSDTITLYNSIYTDYPMALLAGYCIFIVYLLKDDNSSAKYLIYFLSFSSLLISKQMGLVFFLMAAVIAVLLNHKDLKTYVIFILSLIPYFSWNRFVKSNYLGGQFSISRTLSSLLQSGSLDGYRLEIKEKYLDSLFNTQIIETPFKMTYFLYVLFLVLILITVILINKKTDKKVISIPIIYLFGAIGYALLMGIMYIFSFGEVEGLMLASFNRYLTTYLFIGLYLVISFTLILVINIDKLLYFFILIVLYTPFVNFDYLHEINPNHKYKNYLDVHHEYLNQFLLLGEDAKILLIQQWNGVESQEDAWIYYSRINDVDYKVRKRIDAYSFGSRKEFALENLDLTPSEFKEFIKNYDYIVTYVTDDYFYYDYWTKITDTEMYTDCIYSVDVDENGELVFGIVYDYNHK